MQVNIYEAKTRLSELLNLLASEAEEEIVIAKSGVPVAKLIPYHPPEQRKLGAWKGRFRVRWPFALVGRQGWQKYLMSSLPSVSFCFSRPRTAPTPSKESGRPIVAAQTIEQCQLSGSRYSPVG